MVRGWTANRDTTNPPPVFASGLELTNVTSSETVSVAPVQMLTGATWILEPDSTDAKWGYRTGSWCSGDGAPSDTRLLMYDPDRLYLDHYPVQTREHTGHR